MRTDPEPVALFSRRHRVQCTDATPLLILHGLFGSGSNWRRIATALSATRDVHCLDLRNHGQSPWHDAMDYPAMAADVLRFIADHRLGKVALLGHSMGGKVALTLAQRHPAAVSRLIVADIAPRQYSAAAHLALVAAMAGLNLSVSNRGQIDDLLSKKIPDPATRQFLTQNLVAGDRVNDGAEHRDKSTDRFSGKRLVQRAGSAVRNPYGLHPSDQVYRWRLNLPVLQRQMTVLAGWDGGDSGDGAEIPTLFLAGTNSDYLQPTDHPKIHALFPHARIETIADAGHWLHAEQPEAVIALCQGFLG